MNIPLSLIHISKGVDFVAVNTDKQALNVSSATYKIQIGEKPVSYTHLGSGPCPRHDLRRGRERCSATDTKAPEV